MLENKRGAGFHQFSGLSTPVMLWFNAYYISGNVTGGFMSLIYNTVWEKENKGVSFEALTSSRSPCFVICLNGKYDYYFEGASNVTRLCDGTYTIIANSNDGKIKINATPAVL